jgi:CheY-like chemotaxis protein
MPPELYNILIIEDSVSEQKLLKLLFNNSGYTCNVNFLNNGEEAVNYFTNYTEEESSEKPDLIFLDLNLPRIGGLEVLKTIKFNEKLKHTAVIILSTTNNKNEVMEAYESGASGFVRKPAAFEDYEKSLKVILQYWFDICVLN